jgi:hypothetical protein
MRTATALLSLALLATPASAFLAPDRYSGLPFWAEGSAPLPQWFAWTANWRTVDKWVTTMWPEPPKIAGVQPKRADLQLVPPEQYDHPFRGPGELRIIDAASQDEVRQWCPTAVFPKAGAFGCASSKPWGCQVAIASEADLKTVGLTRGMVLRHEVAHCNGWPGDHRGALPIMDWALPEDATNTRVEPSPAQQPASRLCGIAIQKPCE